MILLNYLTALIFTIFIELIGAILFGYREKWFLVVLVLINIMTNPLLNYVISILYNFYFNYTILFFLEIIVIFIEWMILIYVFSEDKKKLFILSLSMNLTSYLFGILIFIFK